MKQIGFSSGFAFESDVSTNVLQVRNLITTFGYILRLDEQQPTRKMLRESSKNTWLFFQRSSRLLSYKDQWGGV